MDVCLVGLMWYGRRACLADVLVFQPENDSIMHGCLWCRENTSWEQDGSAYKQKGTTFCPVKKILVVINNKDICRPVPMFSFLIQMSVWKTRNVWQYQPFLLFIYLNFWILRCHFDHYCWLIIVKYLWKDRVKGDDGKINLRWTHNAIYTNSDPPKSNNPMSSLALLICDFSLLIHISSMEIELLLL
jgi:hypothetical protein